MRQLFFRSILAEAKKENQKHMRELWKKEFCDNEALLISQRRKITGDKRLMLYKRQRILMNKLRENY